MVSGEAYLVHDLQCSGTGIIVDTLPGSVDLNGHTLAGDGTGAAVVLRHSAGESTWPLVTGGRITGWDVGVTYDDVGGAQPELSLWVDVDHVGTVIESATPVRSSIIGATLRDNGVLFDVAAGSTGDIESSLVERNQRVVEPTPGSSYGFGWSTFADNTEVVGPGGGAKIAMYKVDVRRNATVLGAGDWTSLSVVESWFVGNGAVLEAGAAGGTVQGNLFERNTLGLTAGPRADGAGDDPLVVTGNRYRNNVDAIRTLEGAGLHLGDNVVQGNTGWGINAPGATDLGGNLAAGNGNEPQCVGVVCGEAEPTPPLPLGDGPAPVTTCGQYVTGDAYLAQDLHCTGKGIVMAYPGTLDLNGHTLAGDGTGLAVSYLAQEVGLAGDDDRLKVNGGQITDWAMGVGPDHAGSCSGGGVYFTLDDLVVERTRTVVCKDDFLYLDVTDSTFRDNDVLFSGGNSTQLTVERSHVEGTRVIVGRFDDASNYTFGDSTFVDNADFAVGSAMAGFSLVSSHVEGSGQVVGPDEWSNFSLKDNTFVRNDVVVDAGVVWGSVTGNVFEGNRLGVTAALPSGTWWDGTLWVTGNTFVGNVDAIDIPEGATVELGDNVAHDNTGWGIRAPGATDLGGNQAWGNGNEPQCLGVVCAGERS